MSALRPSIYTYFFERCFSFCFVSKQKDDPRNLCKTHGENIHQVFWRWTLNHKWNHSIQKFTRAQKNCRKGEREGTRDCSKMFNLAFEKKFQIYLNRPNIYTGYCNFFVVVAIATLSTIPSRFFIFLDAFSRKTDVAKCSICVNTFLNGHFSSLAMMIRYIRKKHSGFRP